TCLLSTPGEREEIVRVLDRPNTTERCVYLGKKGCIWKVRPISCAMFFCDQAKERVFSGRSDLSERWGELQKGEKEFTLPVKPVLFDELEEYFMGLGVDTPHMYFHKSPGLLRLKARSGLGPQKR
ncbi:MAG: hypothetical protein ACLGPL_07345, partial [Acidobacteriota bacterium]